MEKVLKLCDYEQPILTKEELVLAVQALRHQLAIEEEFGISKMVKAKIRLIWKLQDAIDLTNKAEETK